MITSPPNSLLEDADHFDSLGRDVTVVIATHDRQQLYQVSLECHRPVTMSLRAGPSELLRTSCSARYHAAISIPG